MVRSKLCYLLYQGSHGKGVFSKLLRKIGNIVSIDSSTGWTKLNFVGLHKKYYKYPPILFRDHKTLRWYVEQPLVMANWLPFEYEKEVLHPVLDLIKQGDTVIDIGANVGFFTLLASDRVGPAGKIYAFEPIPETASKIDALKKINDITNIEIVRMAVSNKEARGSMLYSHAGDALATLVEKINSDLDIIDCYKGDVMSVDVPITTLDSYFKENDLKNLSVIKIDAEGAELNILEKSIDVISKNKPVVISEFWGRDVIDKALRIFDDLNYQVNAIEYPGGMTMIVAKPLQTMTN